MLWICLLSNIYCEYFLLVHRLPSYFLNNIFWWVEIFDFDKVQFINISILWLELSLSNLRNLCLCFIIKIFPCSECFLVFASLFKSMIHIKLILWIWYEIRIISHFCTYGYLFIPEPFTGQNHLFNLIEFLWHFVVNLLTL